MNTPSTEPYNTGRPPEITVLACIGLCLLCVQQAERALQAAIATVLDDPEIRMIEQADAMRKETLGDFLKKLKRRVRLPLKVKERLYEFLNKRNQFVHDFPSWDNSTEEGRDAAKLFSLDLMLTALSITGLITAIFQVWARDEHDVEFFEVEDQHTARVIKRFEETFGSLARELLAARTASSKVRSKDRR